MSQAFRGTARAEHLIRGQGGLAGEIGKLRKDTADAFDAAEQGGIFTARFVAPSTDATSANGIKTTFASVAAPVTYTNTDWNGVLAPGTGPAIINTPKRVTLTVGGGGTPADWLGGNVIFSGTAADGSDLEETVASAAGAGTTTTTNYFATLEQVEIVDAQTSTGAQLTLGVLTDTGAIASIASSTSAQVIDAADVALWNQARLGNRRLPFARRISFVFSAAASWIVTTIVVRGRDINGRVISSNILVANGGGTTVTTDKFFAEIDRITIPAQGAALGTCQIGPFSTSVGLPVDPISDVEAVAVVREATRADTSTAWSVPAAGAIDDSSVANAGPYGAYTPATAPNGVREYVVAYLPKAA